MDNTPQPTESEIHIREFLSASPALDKELGEVEIMTGRYTNEEWAAQIAETQRKVLAEVRDRRKEGGRGWKYEAPNAASTDLAKTVDHTVLKLDTKEAQIDALCAEARVENFKSVCVRLPWVQKCVNNLKGTDVVVACVVGFHEGTQDTYEKLHEARAAVAAGAAELDLVLNYSILTKHNPAPSSPQLSSRDSATDTITAANTAVNARPRAGTAATEGPYSIDGANSSVGEEDEGEIPDYSAIYKELASIRALCPSPTVIKLILETSQLTDRQILAAAHLAASANIDFIKTSTGFNGPGATLPHVQLMVTAAEYLSTKTSSNRGSPVRGGGRKMEVKASGGVRSWEDARKMLEAGATRLGTSSGVWIMQEGRKSVEAEAAGKRPGMATRLYTDNSFADGDGY
jgi:deoxyribose-phosphate aldolase